ncbi:hypothetical protein P171DRAFT_127389 [Karstenula rhodostoma CBS 690.94]|uniref:Uncharacterized protein n=1 Tax=Karstenula rhodostoma CBS 690.94 TaxID=1392251 RepID=A0A9P4P8Y7_9PLEO|nr:hypothetical protein P171DRAFT_127389 [Karstenula rhodostoma CBS 690.94]
MADDEGTIYHLLLDKAEANFIHKLRDLDPDGEDPSSERIQKLTDAGTVQLKVSVGDRDLDGTYPVSATALVFGCAEVGLKIQEKLLSQEWIDGAECRSDHHSDAVGMQYHTDEDPSQLVNGKIANETISWDKIRSEVVPSYVQNVTFTIAKSDLMDDRQKELEEQFPGVTIKEASSSQSLSGPNRSAKRQAAPDYTLEKPNGVKTAVFELDKYATTRDEALEANIRKQFPWATIDPAINTPTTPRALRQMAPVVGDVENQLQDFTTFMTDYPPDGMFDVNVRHNQIWSTLPLPTKLNLAHARAIQIGRYSETRVPATRCGNCKRNNYACKIYRHDFIEKVVSTNHLSLGEGCQHCRLLGLKCDLPPYRARSSSSPVGNDMENAGPPRAGRAYSVDLSSEATMTLRASRQLSVAKNFTWKNEMIDLALELGLTLTRPDILWSIYTAWRDRGSIRNYHASSMNLQYYYINLVNLHIMARSIGNPELEFATLLQFQITNFEQEDNLPDINKAVIKAFEHLPVQADLCRWIAIVFSYVWNTVEDGDYEDFLKKNIGVNKAALCKFLYAVAYVRDPHTEGGNLAVLQEWCTVHDHIANSAEDKYCMNAERACKNKLKATESSPNKADNGQNRLNKRSFEGPSGPRRPKKFKHNDGHQYGR